MNEKKLLHESASGHALVGVFVLLAVGFFGWLLLSQRDRTDRYALIAEFSAIQNLSEATKVKLRGFDIGQVEGIVFRPQPPAGESFFLVELGIEEKYVVPEGTVAEIRSSGLVGDTFLNLDVSLGGEEMLAPGSHIEGRDDPGMKRLMGSITEMAHKLGGAGESIRRADLGYRLGHLGESIHRVASTMEKVAGNTDSLMAASHQMVSRMQPDMQRVMVGLDRSLTQLNQTLSRTDTLVARSRDDVEGSVRALRQAVERFDKVLQRVDTLVQHKQAQVDETLTNLHQASEAVREISEHPWKLITGQDKPEE